jgi:hypothetical protein
MEFLGHSTIALTADTYGHIERGMMANAASQIDELLTSQKIGLLLVKSYGQNSEGQNSTP